MAQLGDFLRSINYDKKDVFEQDPTADQDYVSFVINRTLSYFQDTVLFANEVNVYPDMLNQMQFDFLRTTIRPGKRFKKWERRQQHDDLDAVKQYYNYNDFRAQEALQILTDEQIKLIKQRLETGGVKK